MPSATSLVARSYPDRIIGIENRLPWHLGTDLKHFRIRTQGHAIIMGRKTYESIGKPLPNRINIVLSKNNIKEYDNVRWARDPETALLIADQYSIINLRKEFFIIGGEVIYQTFHKYINKVFLTEVFSGRINGDAKFDQDFDAREWWYHSEREFPRSERDDFPFRITCLIRRKPIHRFLSKARFKGTEFNVSERWEQFAAMMRSSSEDIQSEEKQLDFFSEL